GRGLLPSLRKACTSLSVSLESGIKAMDASIARVPVRFVGKIEAQRGHRHVTLFHGPAVSTLLRLLHRNNRKPKVLPPHGVFAGHDPAVIVPDRLTRPSQSLRLPLGKIYIDQGQFSFR